MSRSALPCIPRRAIPAVRGNQAAGVHIAGKDQAEPRAEEMTKTTATDERAAAIVQMYERTGKVVRRVVIEGKRVEVEFMPQEATDGPDFVQW